MSRPDFRHTFRLFGVLAVLIAAAAAARYVAVPTSFGERGYYRGDAMQEAMERTPLHIGNATCAECHDDKAELHAKDAHAKVPCETCHGPAGQHPEDPDQHKVLRPEGKAPCLTCHQRLLARPGAFPQIELEAHYRFVGVKDPSVTCQRCHDPHEPLFMDRDKRSARLHPLVHRCRDCHVGRVDEQLAKPADHPAIFECGYCHRDTVDDFATRPHSGVRCTTCHLFLKESDFAGRIVRDADPRFCLLCHRDAEFRSDDAAPGISWPEHRDDMSEGPADADKRCIDCHRDRIHAPSAQQGGTDEP